jgi:two-component system LytT family response regulator
MNWLVVEDESTQARALCQALMALCPEATVDVVSELTGLEAVRGLGHYDAAMVDIMMGGSSVFDRVDVSALASQLVFVTAHEGFWRQAFEAHAVDYLLKPVDPERLAAAVRRVRQCRDERLDAERYRLLQDTVRLGRLTGLAVPTAEGIRMLRIVEIVAAEASRSYCRLHLASGEVLLVSRTLGWVEQRLAGEGFLRTHRSWLVNPAHIREWIRIRGHVLQMVQGLTVDVSRAYLERLRAWLRRHAGYDADDVSA